MALWFFQPRKPVRVYAQAGSEVFSRSSRSDGGLRAGRSSTFDDGAAACLGRELGAARALARHGGDHQHGHFRERGRDTHRRRPQGRDDGGATSASPRPMRPTPRWRSPFWVPPCLGIGAVGDFVGPMRDETRLFLERVTTGKEVPALRRGNGALGARTHAGDGRERPPGRRDHRTTV